MGREDTGVPNEGTTCAWMAADEAVGCCSLAFYTMWRSSRRLVCRERPESDGIWSPTVVNRTLFGAVFLVFKKLAGCPACLRLESPEIFCRTSRNNRYLSTTEKMPRRRIRSHLEQMSELEKGGIIGLREADWANWRIARHMGRSDVAIRRCWQEWVESGRFQRYDSSG
ncbi:uncharacterized protein TNCV_4938291 [Trichonephila clavipes]|nr:uncharacterized protein TNCV_4938291 [Trichonephila clavipes]